ncbi:MAG TPA: hypothetical protein PKE29_04875 [Phycisphaerales bacterium]|nr:hypothetical protein [Phycisphaerales bacterium]
MPRPAVWITLLVLQLSAGGCSHDVTRGSDGAESPFTYAVEWAGADPGLELTTFISGVDERTLAAALNPFADGPVPLARELEGLWASYGFRIVSVPVEEVAGLVGTLRTTGSTQRQWLGQAFSWTEVVRAGHSSGRVIALDAERIRLAPGSLRLLVRSWIEPTPPRVSVGGGGGEAAPEATLRVEMVPQNRESRTTERSLDLLAVNEPRLEAESQGLLFSRLYTRMSMFPGRALVIVPDRPDADWGVLAVEGARGMPGEAEPAGRKSDATDPGPWAKRAAAEVSVPDAAVSLPPERIGPPKLGEVVRAAPRGVAPPAASSTGAPAVVGPVVARVPTLGEAMLMGGPAPSAGGPRPPNAPPPQRVVLVLVPRVPKEFRLLGPAPESGPAPASATPSAAGSQPG